MPPVSESQEARIVSEARIRPSAPSDRDAILSLLQQGSLPFEDIDRPSVVDFWVAQEGERVVGAVGVERYGSTGLLRSLVVAPTHRDRGIGARLVATLERDAHRAGISQLVLLTGTARAFFERCGYAAIDRAAAPDAVQASTEFRSLCPASADCMSKSFGAVAHQRATPSRTTRVLFLCTGNSCRSILAEATFNHLAPDGWRAMSAGSHPTGKVHPRSLALLAREGIPADGSHSKSWDDLAQAPDIVITVCANAAGETCPAYLGRAIRAHWGVDDPAHATGTDIEIDAAFLAAYQTLRNRIEALLALPLAELRSEPQRLQVELERIGTQVA